MCNLSEVVEERGVQKGRREVDVLSLKALMKNLNIPLEQALTLLEFSEEDYREYRKLLAEQYF